MNGPVLVGTDFSPAARRAVDLAGRLAAQSEASLEVAHVWNPNALTSALF